MFSYIMNEMPRMFTIHSVVSAINAVRPKDFYFAGEMHNFWEVVYIMEGKVAVSADERVYLLTDGQLIFHKPMEFHRIWSADGTAPHILIISFEAEGIKMKAFENKVFYLDMQKEKMLANIVSDASSIIEMASSGQKYSEQYGYLAHITAIRIEFFLLELLRNNTTEKALQTPEKSEIYRHIVDIMNKHCCEALSLGQIAALCNMSVSSLKKAFQKFSDKGVMKYFNCLKIRKAVSMLDEGLPIKEVSARLAFSSQNYFHVVFKRETGCSPGNYRNRNTTVQL